MLDLVSQEILKNVLVNITREMGGIMARTSYSAILNEGKDYSCAIFDAKGDLSAEAEFVLVHLACMHFSVKACVDDFGAENFDPGDIVLHNDPYLGGSHLPDINMIRPIHVDGELIAFAANRAHYPDVGGIAPGSFAGEAEEILHEGVRIPPMKLYKKDQLDEQLLRLWSANVRAPKRIYADSAAQVASIRIGERRILELVEQEGVDNVKAGIEYIKDYAEKLMRSRIQKIPDGVYRYFDYMDDSGVDTDPVRIECAMIVEDDQLTFDFEGTEAQVKCPINAPYAVTSSAAFGAAKCILAPDGPLNAGTYRALKLLAPEGTLVNAQHPAPVAAGNTNTSQRIFGIILGCMAQAAPELVEASEYGANSDIGLGGTNPRNGDPYVLYMMPVGGMGARPKSDGNTAVINSMGNCSNQPAEVWETMYPFRVNHWRLRTDSAGAGEFRGGSGYEVQYESLDEEALLSIFTERVHIPPFGVFEGLPSKNGRYILDRPKQGSEELKTKLSRLDFPAGSTFTSFTAGGGGYGHPFQRDPESVHQDYIEGFISQEHAAETYGVVIDEHGDLDLQRTATIRENNSLYVDVEIANVIDLDEDATGRVVRMNQDLAHSIGCKTGDLVQLSQGVVPLRGWIKIDEGLSDQEVAIPQTFSRVLGWKRGSRVQLRNGLAN